MGKRRIYGCADVAIYHCISRTVNGEMVFGDREKEQLRRMLRQVADFSGVEVLTYAIMSNHIHVLVRVDRRAGEVSDDELIRRFKVLYPKPVPHRPEDPEIVSQMLRENTADGQKLRGQLQQRMGDVSEFMKTLKQRFSFWFNRHHGRFGPVWSDRFSSTIIEGTSGLLRTVAAYIDLNPIRAGLVEDPKDYRFCGYAEAVAGDSAARRGVREIVGLDKDSEALKAYRVSLFGKGAAPKPDGSGQRISPEAFHKVMKQGGALPVHEMILHRVCYFACGAVLGSAAFVQDHIDAWSAPIGDLRKRTPKPIGPADLGEVTAFRNTHLK